MLSTGFEEETPWGPSTVALPLALTFALFMGASKYCLGPSIRQIEVQIDTEDE